MFASRIGLAAALLATFLPSFASAQNYQYFRERKTGRVLYIKNTAAFEPGLAPDVADQINLINGTTLTYSNSTSSRFSSDPVLISESFLREHASNLGIANPRQELVPAAINVDDLGIVHVTYEERLNGVPVVGGLAKVHLNPRQEITFVSVNLAPSAVALKPKAGLTAAKAERYAISAWKSDNKTRNTPTSLSAATLAVLNAGVINQDNSTKTYLVWVVNVGSERPLAITTYYIDAKSGAVRHRVKHVKAIEGIERIVADCSYNPSSGKCGWYDAARADFPGYIWGRREGMPVRGVNPIYGYNDVDLGYDLLEALRAHTLNTYGRNGCNGVGGTGGMVPDATHQVLVASDKARFFTYYDAMDPAGCPNALWAWTTGYFCAGTLDASTAMHEYSHGIIDFTVTDTLGRPLGLSYQGEDGALEESFADVMGFNFERSSRGATDYIAWKKTSLEPQAGMWRNLLNPPSVIDATTGLPAPDTHYSSGFYCGGSDNGGVHTNSNVPSKAVTLLATGGKFNGCTIEPIDLNRAARVLFRAATTYYRPYGNFQAAYGHINQACSDLYGSDKNVCKQVRRALQAVEMDQPGRCSGVARVTPACTDSCLDNEPANDIYTPGTVTWNGNPIADKCTMRNTKVLQYTCTGNSVVTLAEQYCPKGCNAATGACNR